MKKFSSGFTLIELLVVIAIIGILSSVVLASLSTARSKGQDAKVQESMSSLRNEAEIFANSVTPAGYSTGSAATGCATAGSLFLDTASNASSTINSIIATATTGTVTCVSSSTAWAVQAPLPSGSGYWCADSTGKSEKENATPVPSLSQLCQ